MAWTMLSSLILQTPMKEASRATVTATLRFSASLLAAGSSLMSSVGSMPRSIPHLRRGLDDRVVRIGNGRHARGKTKGGTGLDPDAALAVRLLDANRPFTR